jgi:hypothetical protein
MQVFDREGLADVVKDLGRQQAGELSGIAIARLRSAARWRRVKLLVALVVTGWGASLMIPRVARPFETLTEACRLDDGTLVRFFIGNGGATTAIWYSVTAQPGMMPWSERRLFSAYSRPQVTGVSCQKDDVVVRGSDQQWVVAAQDVLAGRAGPIRYRHGELHPARALDARPRLSWIRVVFGIALWAGGIAAMVRLRRTRL